MKKLSPKAELSTPAVTIDERRMRVNVERMSRLAREHSLALRPHIKTHKSTELARIQMDAGAVGCTASKSDEASVFIAAGIPSLTVAYPLVDPRRIVPLVELAADRTALRFVVDSIEGLDALAAAARRTGSRLAALIEIDVGLGRCGLRPDGPELLALARAIAGHDGLELAGILSHAGHAYAAADLEEVRAIARDEQQTMRTVRALLERDGISVGTVSIGSTPTLLAADRFDGVDEIRPGNYIVLDRIQVGLGVARYDDVALSVLTTIVSRNDRFYIVDAGSKSLSSDRGAHGVEAQAGFGMAFTEEIADGAPSLLVARLSEEHGFIDRSGTDLPIGTRLRVVPNHACPVVNLADRIYLVGDDEARALTVDARGRV